MTYDCLCSELQAPRNYASQIMQAVSQSSCKLQDYNAVVSADSPGRYDGTTGAFGPAQPPLAQAADECSVDNSHCHVFATFSEACSGLE